MPIYEFCCQSCDNRFEELVSAQAGQNGGIKCPACASGKVRRLISPFSFRSSGSGGSAQAGKNCGPCTKTSCAGCG